MSRLSRLPVDSLKIDRSFVRDVGTERGQGVVRAIIALAETHGLDVVAEGVEQASDLTVLVELGVGRVQGNFLGRAAPNLPVRGPRPATEALPVVPERLRSVRPLGVPRPAGAPEGLRVGGARRSR
jgi:EAL domain-containing protein (putative c-di-GMP-specific phosphodiesterase class I)